MQLCLKYPGNYTFWWTVQSIEGSRGRVCHQGGYLDSECSPHPPCGMSRVTCYMSHVTVVELVGGWSSPTGLPCLIFFNYQWKFCYKLFIGCALATMDFCAWLEKGKGFVQDPFFLFFFGGGNYPWNRLPEMLTFLFR